jgi:hypothetical protein
MGEERISIKVSTLDSIIEELKDHQRPRVHFTGSFGEMEAEAKEIQSVIMSGVLNKLMVIRQHGDKR